MPTADVTFAELCGFGNWRLHPRECGQSADSEEAQKIPGCAKNFYGYVAL
jgi:hypothetical protein